MKPEDRSDDLDARILAVSAIGYKQERLRTALVAATLVFVVVGSVGQFIIIRRLTIAHTHLEENTNYVVSSQIPGLESQIKQRDDTISDQRFVLEQQAVPAIVKLSQQVKDLGGDPGQVILKPPE